MKNWGTATFDHVSLFWKTYVGVASVVAFGIGFHLVLARMEGGTDVTTWSAAEAFIAEASVTEHPDASATSMKTYLVANLVLEYDVDGRHHRSPVFRRWNRKVPTNYESELAAGKTITIRYDPEAPTIVSLSPLIPD